MRSSMSYNAVCRNDVYSNRQTERWRLWARKKILLFKFLTMLSDPPFFNCTPVVTSNRSTSPSLRHGIWTSGLLLKGGNKQLDDATQWFTIKAVNQHSGSRSSVKRGREKRRQLQDFKECFTCACLAFPSCLFSCPNKRNGTTKTSSHCRHLCLFKCHLEAS